MARERQNEDAKCGDAMNFDVRPMALHETDLIIDYFHGATPEHLEKLGVDPTRLPAVDAGVNDMNWNTHGLSSIERPSWLSGRRAAVRSASQPPIKLSLAKAHTCICTS